VSGVGAKLLGNVGVERTT